jgi:hypothetical protein
VELAPAANRRPPQHLESHLETKAALMRSRGIQNVLLVVVFAAVVAGLTFARQWLSIPTSKAPNTPAANNMPDPPLRMSGALVSGGFISEMRPARGHLDLWFENLKDEQMELGLEQASCKCVGVQVTLITSEESKKIQKWLPVAGSTQVGFGFGGFLASVGPAIYSMSQVRDIYQDESRWHQMKLELQDPTPFPVPGHSQGLIRLEWEGRKIGPERVTANLWVQPAGKPGTRWYSKLEMPLVFVTPLLTAPNEASLDLGPSDRKTASFWCWSSTRAGFQLSAREETNSPNISCTCVPLLGPEYKLAMEKLKVGDKSPNILFGYRVAVTVAERLDNGTQLDLGDFSRRIILTSSDQEFFSDVHEVTLDLKGHVQGEVSVGVASDKSKVNLGVYPVTRGTNTVVLVETHKPGLKLKKVEQIPSFLDVELNESGVSFGGVRYKMKVVVPPNQGTLPDDSAIILETQDKPSRKVRIPVVGTASIPIRSGS